MSNLAEGPDSSAVSLSLSEPSDDSATPTIVGVMTESEEVDLDTMTVSELKALCKERGLTGYSSLTKTELIDMLKGE